MIRRPPRSTRVRSSAASDVYKRQVWRGCCGGATSPPSAASDLTIGFDRSVLAKLASCLTASTDVRDRHEYSRRVQPEVPPRGCLLYTSDAADDLTRVDLGGRRSLK